MMKSSRLKGRKNRKQPPKSSRVSQGQTCQRCRGKFFILTFIKSSHISYFPKPAFALLKGRTWQFSVQKLQILIGRTLYSTNIPNKEDKGYRWHIDLEIGNNRKISRQHACIIYNFEQENFEIKCLSKKYYIKVNNSLYNHKDKPILLRNKSLITIGNETFYFFLPKTNSNTLIEEEMQEKQEKDDIEDEEQR